MRYWRAVLPGVVNASRMVLSSVAHGLSDCRQVTPATWWGGNILGFYGNQKRRVASAIKRFGCRFRELIDGSAFLATVDMLFSLDHRRQNGNGPERRSPPIGVAFFLDGLGSEIHLSPFRVRFRGLSNGPPHRRRENPARQGRVVRPQRAFPDSLLAPPARFRPCRESRPPRHTCAGEPANRLKWVQASPFRHTGKRNPNNRRGQTRL